MDLLTLIVVPLVVGIIIVVIGLVIEYWIIQPLRNSQSNSQLKARILQRWQVVTDTFNSILTRIRNLHRGVVLVIGVIIGVKLFSIVSPPAQVSGPNTPLPGLQPTLTITTNTPITTVATSLRPSSSASTLASASVTPNVSNTTNTATTSKDNAVNVSVLPALTPLPRAGVGRLLFKSLNDCPPRFFTSTILMTKE